MYRYVGPREIRERASTQGVAIHRASDLVPFADGSPLTFVIDAEGILRVADRHSEHVACAGGREVFSAGEFIARRDGDGCRIAEITNQSTGYCPEPSSFAAVAVALDRAGIAHEGRFTIEIIFRKCESCGQRNIVKDDWFVCAACDAPLPQKWNFAR